MVGPADHIRWARWQQRQVGDQLRGQYPQFGVVLIQRWSAPAQIAPQRRSAHPSGAGSGGRALGLVTVPPGTPTVRVEPAAHFLGRIRTGDELGPHRGQRSATVVIDELGDDL